jgi:hypothetical protein
VSDAKLWECKHPYYCNEMNFFANAQTGGPWEFGSWRGFFAEYGDSDPDYNLVFRFDWKAPDADAEREHHLLQVFFVGQRKGNFWCCLVRVTEADEPAARNWLAGRYRHLLKLWTPFAEVGRE